GHGRLARRMAAAGMRVTGVDATPAYLEMARSDPKLPPDGVTYLEGDVRALPVTGPFDAVVCWLNSFGYYDDADCHRVLEEFHRVLRPGGTVVFAGEPSRYGDRLARIPKRAAAAAAPLWRRAIGAAPVAPVDANGDHHAADHALESEVDIHAFAPAELADFAARAGLVEVRVSGEELLANWFGWTNRVLESTAAPEDIPWAWRQYAFRGYLALQRLDTRLLEPRLPARIFYNLLLTARRP
ncbi:MAG TPA: class I SAM-dependent methyltransferase, partial [Solirubrobacteraceae bacterium]|nr:class I SAM-dependent methyltransferase [Solirubrobacteraceae bacterium]